MRWLQETLEDFPGLGDDGARVDPAHPGPGHVHPRSTHPPWLLGDKTWRGLQQFSPPKPESLELGNLSTELKISCCIFFRNSLPSCGE